MKTWIPACAALVLGLCGSRLVPPASPVTQDPEKPMAGMMAKARKFTQPGERHKLLERFVGEWEVATSITMGGAGGPPSKGSAKCEWLMKGRWLQTRWSGAMMGMPIEAVTWIGYDNMKMSYVWAQVKSIDTALLTAEGDMTHDGKALLLYGTMDEYLTGEHDKMVKYVYRFESEDKIVLEVHDLPIGETNTKVVESVFTRQR